MSLSAKNIDGFVKTTIKIPCETWRKIRDLQQTRHLSSIQHAVELGLQWVVATSQERKKAELNEKADISNTKTKGPSEKKKRRDQY